MNYPIFKYIKMKNSQLNFYRNQSGINKTLLRARMKLKAQKVIFQNKNLLCLLMQIAKLTKFKTSRKINFWKI